MIKKIYSLLAFAFMMSASSAFAANDVVSSVDYSWVAMAAGFAIGIAALGGALGQGMTAGRALEGMARNPAASDKLFTPMIIGLVLIESLVIYALVVAILLVLKVP